MPSRSSILNKIRRTAEQRTKPYGCHAWDHVERVYNLCLHIGKKEHADLEILKIAALLHDIKRDGGQSGHAEESAEEAELILRSLHLSPAKISKIVNTIKTHSFRGGRKPLTLEAKVLSDADKLDAMGATGIYRASAYGAETRRNLQRTITHFHEKLLKLQGLMRTKTAKRLAEKRNQFMLAYLTQLQKELKLKS